MRAAQLVSYEKDFSINQVDDPAVTDPLDVIVTVGSAESETITFPFEGVNEALHALDDGRLVGRGVLVPAAS